jgi:hypothetical protein
VFKEIIVVKTENLTRPTNRERTLTDWKSRWYIQTPLGFIGLKLSATKIPGKKQC